MKEKIRQYFENLIERGIISREELSPSTVMPEQIEALERECGVTFPEVFKEYLMTYCYDFTTIQGVALDSCGELDRQYMEFINIPKENPLKLLREFLEGIRGTGEECFADGDIFLRNGYLPFGDYGAGWGVCCFDTKKKESDVDFDDPETWTVVWFDHEEVIDGGALEELAIPAAPTFCELLEWFFAGKYEEEYESEE